MILELDHWHFGYEQILTDCRAGEETGTVLLLCNTDVDAMASARILSYMLRSDGIHYQLLPCSNYSSLHKHLSTAPMDDVKAVVLLNFGAARNLTRLFEQVLTEQVKLYIMDCRRPVHLANIYAGENVVIFWDQTQGDDMPSDGDNLSGNESSSSEESEDGSDDDDDDDDSSVGDLDENPDEGEEEAEFDDVVAEPKEGFFEEPKNQETDYDGEDERDTTDARTRQRDGGVADVSSLNTQKRRRTETDGVADPEEGDDAVTDVEPESPDSKKEPEKLQDISPQELHRQRRDRLRTYYSSGSFFGSPAAYVAYRLAAQLRFGEQSDLLWLACVGVTDAYRHARLDVAGYTSLALDLRRYCLRLFPNDMYERAVNTVYAEDLTGSGAREDPQNRTKITFDENGRIISEKDYRFFLLRHSSLFDSMVHSDYVSTKLQVWTKRGMHKLQEMLAKMGYPLDECRQPFAFMKPSLRRRLTEKIVLHAGEYGLENFEFTSFFRVTGYQSLLSASDTSFAVTALLECETPATTAAASGSGEIDEDKEAIESFNIAYDALNPNVAPTVSLNGLCNEGHDASSLVNGGNLAGNTGIGAGIRLAMSLQRSIISTAVSLVDRNAITRLRHFRYAYLTCTSAGENQTSRAEIIRTGTKTEEEKHHIFAKPLALSRLAHYLMDMHRENEKWVGNKARPLVLMAEKPNTGTYLVVGYEYPERSGSFVKNRFGLNFELTAKSMNGTFKFDSFDSNVVEVNGSDVQRFIEQLHYLMDSI